MAFAGVCLAGPMHWAEINAARDQALRELAG